MEFKLLIHFISQYKESFPETSFSMTLRHFLRRFTRQTTKYEKKTTEKVTTIFSEIYFCLVKESETSHANETHYIRLFYCVASLTCNTFNEAIDDDVTSAFISSSKYLSKNPGLAWYTARKKLFSPIYLCSLCSHFQTLTSVHMLWIKNYKFKKARVR